jgi:hypothetical protein
MLYLMNMKIWKLTFVAIWTMFRQVAAQETTLQTWDVHPYKVDLIEVESPLETHYEMRIYTERHVRRYRRFVISKDGVEVEEAMNCRVSKDSCVIDFVEYERNRPKNGVVGNDVTINLCSRRAEIKKINKPQIDPKLVSAAFITPLDSNFHNPYNVHAPLKVVNYGRGEKRALHQKHIEGFAVIFESLYLFGKFRQDEFTGQQAPHFKVELIHNGKQLNAILYWNLILIDGYMYGFRSTGPDAFDVRFWESNLKLIGEME